MAFLQELATEKAYQLAIANLHGTEEFIPADEVIAFMDKMTAYYLGAEKESGKPKEKPAPKAESKKKTAKKG